MSFFSYNQTPHAGSAGEAVVVTDLESLVSGTHGRERRLERGIEKVDLQRAMKYGMMEPARFGRLKYTYGGLVFIYEPTTNYEVTSYKSQYSASDISGTCVADAIIISKKEAYEDYDEIELHGRVREDLVDR